MTKVMLAPGMGHCGLGPEIGGADSNPYFSHRGVNAGFVGIFVAYEKNGEGAVVMTNGEGGDLLVDEIMRGIAVEYGWPDYRPAVRTEVQLVPKVMPTGH